MSGAARFTYQVSAEDWGNLPEGWSYKGAAAVAVESHDYVHVFNRGSHPMMVFNPDGNVLRAWGEGVFSDAHGMSIGPGDSVYCVDKGGHTI